MHATIETRKTIVIEHGGEITGYATVRACHEGVKIGPVVAQTEADAMILIRGAARIFDTSPIIVDVPDTQTILRDRLMTLGFAATFETAHMFRGTAPEVSETYRAVASMECG